jgi:hypothetical protein
LNTTLFRQGIIQVDQTNHHTTPRQAPPAPGRLVGEVVTLDLTPSPAQISAAVAFPHYFPMTTNVTQLLDPRTLYHTPEDLIPFLTSAGWTRTSRDLHRCWLNPALSPTPTTKWRAYLLTLAHQGYALTSPYECITGHLPQ